MSKPAHEPEELAEIRRAVRSLCDGFPGEYWRAKDAVREYPAEFVDALTEAGFLAALIPVEHGGSGLSLEAACVIMEEIQASGCNGSSAHAQMYIMNTLLRYGSAEQKAAYLPRIASGELRLQAFGLARGERGVGAVHGELEVIAFERDQQLAFFHVLVVLHQDLLDARAQLTRDSGDLALDISVVGAFIKASLEEPMGEKAPGDQQDEQ